MAASFIFPRIKRVLITLGLVLCACISPALAQSAAQQDPQTRLWLTYTVGSLHTQNASQFNQKNPGFGLEIPFKTPLASHTHWVAGRIKNSDNEQSNYLGVQATPWSLSANSGVRAGAVLGLIDGYTRVRNGKAFPLLMPVLAFETQASGLHLGANVFVIPPVAGIPLTFALQLKAGF